MALPGLARRWRVPAPGPLAEPVGAGPAAPLRATGVGGLGRLPRGGGSGAEEGREEGVTMAGGTSGGARARGGGGAAGPREGGGARGGARRGSKEARESGRNLLREFVEEVEAAGACGQEGGRWGWRRLPRCAGGGWGRGVRRMMAVVFSSFFIRKSLVMRCLGIDHHERQICDVGFSPAALKKTAGCS